MCWDGRQRTDKTADSSDVVTFDKYQPIHLRPRCQSDGRVQFQEYFITLWPYLNDRNDITKNIFLNEKYFILILIVLHHTEVKSTWDYVLVCCLTAASHYMNQCWPRLVISCELQLRQDWLYQKLVSSNYGTKKCIEPLPDMWWVFFCTILWSCVKRPSRVTI